MKEQMAALGTDRELWREREGDYYANSIHVTATGGIGINVGGYVVVKPLADWHKLAAPNGPPRLLTDGADSPSNKGQDTPSPSTEGEGGGEDAREAAKRIVDWDDNGRLADDEWLVERNETAIIAICRALLSSPDARREALEEALKEVDDLLDEYPPDLIGTGGHPGQAEEARVDRIMEAVRERVERRQAAIRALKETKP